METPYQPPKKDDGITCPECGSTNVGINEDVDVKSKPDNKPLTQYTCGDCECTFIPAMEDVDKTIGGWAKKMRFNENMNNGSWKKAQKYIVIKKKKEK
jgi:DNA-directed RNA polymerase subunit RPC12/RpoP